LLFVHIPKCGGTDFRETMMTRYPLVDTGLGDAAWTSPAMLLAAVQLMLSLMRHSDTLIAHGHLSLGWYLDHQLKRPQDRIAAIVREPVDLVISRVNYVMTVLLTDAESRRPDTREWRAKLRLTDAAIAPDQATLADLADRVMFETDLLGTDCLCEFLGNGDAASARDMIARSGIEITDLVDYPAWLHEGFGVHSTRRNASMKILRRDSLSARQLDRFMDLTRQDRVLYAGLRSGLWQTRRVSAKGRDRPPLRRAAR
jgi:hypothetical protein